MHRPSELAKRAAGILLNNKLKPKKSTPVAAISPAPSELRVRRVADVLARHRNVNTNGGNEALARAVIAAIDGGENEDSGEK